MEAELTGATLPFSNIQAINKGETYTSMAAFSEGEGRYEYLLVIPPGETVHNKVIAEEKNFDNQYSHKVSVKTRPYITVANFLAREEMEETMIRWIQRISSQQMSFPVTLNNFSGFPPHTIYIRVQDHQPFKNLVTQLTVIDQYVRSNRCPPVYFNNRPHLTLARRLPQEVYEKAMMDYSQKLFYELFIANELVLLRRAHQFDTCRVVNVFRLLPGENQY